ncbi:hypothetical protein GOV12_03235 [Candidatus Pacearchaeota archaeon]|nr:hypothetical protein [Candidatus Pacearchaeota archaeon]
MGKILPLVLICRDSDSEEIQSTKVCDVPDAIKILGERCLRLSIDSVRGIWAVDGSGVNSGVEVFYDKKFGYSKEFVSDSDGATYLVGVYDRNDISQIGSMVGTVIRRERNQTQLEIYACV